MTEDQQLTVRLARAAHRVVGRVLGGAGTERIEEATRALNGILNEEPVRVLLTEARGQLWYWVRITVAGGNEITGAPCPWFPYWPITGPFEEDDLSRLRGPTEGEQAMAFVRDLDDVFRFWPAAHVVVLDQGRVLEFTEAYPKPSWWKE